MAIGSNSLVSSIGGTNNVAIGEDALSSLISGNNNVAIGTDALKGNDGSANVGIGQWAGRNNTGYRNIFIGHGAGDASGNVSNRLFIDMAPSSFPLIYGEFDNELLRINGTLDIKGVYQFPTTDGTAGQALTTDGSGNVTWGSTGGGVFDVVSNVVQPNSSVTNATDDFVFGSTSLDFDFNMDHSHRFFFDKSQGAFRAGGASGTGWSSTNIGLYSVAMGAEPTASGSASVAFGNGAKAYGDFSMAWGGFSEAAGQYATAGGRETSAPSAYEVTFGSYNTIYNPGSTGNWVAGHRAFTIGNGTSIGNRSNALIVYKSGKMTINDAYTLPNVDGSVNQLLTTDGSGNVTWATPNGGAFEAVSGVVMSNSSVDITSDDFVFGATQLDDDTVADHDNRFYFDKSKGAFRAGTSGNDFWDDSYRGSYSFAGGYSTRSGGDYSMAFGQYGDSSGSHSASWGNQNTASGYGSTSFGMYNSASGGFSTVWGYSSTATKSYATAWGERSEAKGTHATAWGEYTDAYGDYSTAFGERTSAPSAYETVFGYWNTTYTPVSTTAWDSSDRLLVIGNGTSSSNRSNALTLKKNGDLGLGIDAPIAKLDVRPGDNTRGLYINHDKTTTGTAYGAHIDVDHTAGTSNTIYGALIDATKTGATSNSVYGVYGRAYDIQTGTGTRYIYGLRGYSSVSSSNGTTNSRGVYGSTGGNGDNEYGGYFVGDVYSTGAYQTSDRKLKKNIHEYKGALEKLTQLKIKSYNFKTKEYQHLNLPEGKQIGVIAQDLEKIFPGMVKRADESVQLISREDARDSGIPYNEVGDKDMVEVGKDVEILAVNYTNLVPVLIQATKEQQTTIENQAAKIENLESRLQKIEQLLLEKNK